MIWINQFRWALAEPASPNLIVRWHSWLRRYSLSRSSSNDVCNDFAVDTWSEELVAPARAEVIGRHPGLDRHLGSMAHCHDVLEQRCRKRPDRWLKSPSGAKEGRIS